MVWSERTAFNDLLKIACCESKAKKKFDPMSFIPCIAVLIIAGCFAGCAGMPGPNGLNWIKPYNPSVGLPSVDGISHSSSQGLVEGVSAIVGLQENSANDQPELEKLPDADVIPVNYVKQTGCPAKQHCSASGPCAVGSCFSYSCGEENCAIQLGQRVRDRQEYIFDGGDLEPQVSVKRDWTATGINETDTVVYYETPGGKVCIQPSNRVGIYAPRFGVVRQVTGAVFAENTQSTGRVLSPVSAHGLEDQNRTSGLSLSTGPIAQKQMLQLDRLHDERNPTPIASVIPPTPLQDAVFALINVDIAAIDYANLGETTAIEESTAMVQNHWIPESLSVFVSGQEAVAINSTNKASEVVVYDSRDGCSIQIRKQVSHREAHPGDIIRFSISFENIGPSRAGNVVIIDSLSPRLEYIEGSQLSSVKTRFTETPNDAGSNLLRWELESPVEVNDSGVISFDCRVR
jgi:uncharacterized repeat protein (TIGR01451 family)